MADEFDPFDIENIRSAEAVAGEAALRADAEARKIGDAPAKPTGKHIPRSTKRFVKVPGNMVGGSRQGKSRRQRVPRSRLFAQAGLEAWQSGKADQ